MEDPNTGVAMYESASIVTYMATNYADGVTPTALVGPLSPLLLGLSLLPRAGKGGKYRPSSVTAATKPLTLWAYEASPFCTIVREVLTELGACRNCKVGVSNSDGMDAASRDTACREVVRPRLAQAAGAL